MLHVKPINYASTHQRLLHNRFIFPVNTLLAIYKRTLHTYAHTFHYRRGDTRCVTVTSRTPRIQSNSYSTLAARDTSALCTHTESCHAPNQHITTTTNSRSRVLYIIYHAAANRSSGTQTRVSHVCPANAHAHAQPRSRLRSYAPCSRSRSRCHTRRHTRHDRHQPKRRRVCRGQNTVQCARARRGGNRVNSIRWSPCEQGAQRLFMCGA